MAAEIKHWLRQSFNATDIKILHKSGGFVGEIFFAEVKTKEENHHLAIKVGKKDEESRRLMPISEAGLREIFFYNQILPTFNKFQIEKNVTDPFNAAPKCYNTFLEDNTEVIILENLKKKGYELHKGSKSLNVNHQKSILKNLAKFHGLSFALNDQKPEIFKQLTTNSQHLYKSSVGVMKDIYAYNIKKVLTVLKDKGEENLSKRYENYTAEGVGNILSKIYNADPKEKVITHGDCHNYNFFFKYEDINKENPIEMKIVDFQISCLHSPVLDLSYFWYTGSSKNEMPHFNELIQFYHKELSTFLKELGSDPNNIFPISKLWQHWQKYSKYGFIMSSLFMDNILFEKEKTFMAEEEINQNVLDDKVLKEAYEDRLIAVIDYYFKNN